MSLIGKCLGFNAPIETIHTNTIQVMASLSVDQLQRLVEISDNPMIINGDNTGINKWLIMLLMVLLQANIMSTGLN